MEELKLLIEMVRNLPALAIWVLAGYLVYKLVVLGSIYGVLRLLIVKAHDFLTGPKQMKLGRKSIDTETASALNEQLDRIGSMHYIHMSDVKTLREALDAKMNK